MSVSMEQKRDWSEAVPSGAAAEPYRAPQALRCLKALIGSIDVPGKLCRQPLQAQPAPSAFGAPVAVDYVRLLWCDAAGIRRCRWACSRCLPRMSLEASHRRHHCRRRRHYRYVHPLPIASSSIPDPSPDAYITQNHISHKITCAPVPCRVVPRRKLEEVARSGVGLAYACFWLPSWGDVCITDDPAGAPVGEMRLVPDAAGEWEGGPVGGLDALRCHVKNGKGLMGGCQHGKQQLHQPHPLPPNAARI